MYHIQGPESSILETIYSNRKSKQILNSRKSILSQIKNTESDDEEYNRENFFKKLQNQD